MRRLCLPNRNFFLNSTVKTVVTHRVTHAKSDALKKGNRHQLFKWHDTTEWPNSCPTNIRINLISAEVFIVFDPSWIHFYKKWAIQDRSANEENQFLYLWTYSSKEYISLMYLSIIILLNIWASANPKFNICLSNFWHVYTLKCSFPRVQENPNIISKSYHDAHV